VGSKATAATVVFAVPTSPVFPNVREKMEEHGEATNFSLPLWTDVSAVSNTISFLLQVPSELV
jgi:hypothetical protein